MRCYKIPLSFRTCFGNGLAPRPRTYSGENGTTVLSSYEVWVNPNLSLDPSSELQKVEKLQNDSSSDLHTQGLDSQSNDDRPSDLRPLQQTLARLRSMILQPPKAVKLSSLRKVVPISC